MPKLRFTKTALEDLEILQKNLSKMFKQVDFWNSLS